MWHNIYQASDWGDQIASIRAYDFEYDAVGNPLTYYNGNYYVMSWDGTRLASAVVDGVTCTFTYNSDGLRTSKTVSGTTTHYYYDGTRLIAEITNGDITAYMYDAYGSVIGFQYADDAWNGAFWATYLYGKNAQGDVVAVYDGQGVLRVSYAYNAWGYATVTYHGCDATSTAAKNPIRYRGYYYDKNLEMYYLQSRYYDPVLCRFISPASALNVTSESLDGLNLYVYANNNPVNVLHTYNEMTTNLSAHVSAMRGVSKTNISLYTSTENFDFLSDSLSFYENMILVTSGVIDASGRSNGFGQSQSLTCISKVLMHTGYWINIGLCAYNNYNNASLAVQEKWISFSVDTVHITGQTVGGYFLGCIPYAGPFLAIVIPTAVNYIWYGELNIAGFTIDAEPLLVDGKTLEELVKEWINSWID